MSSTPNKLFGSRRRTEILIMLGLLEETYASELARLLGAPLYSVQTILRDLQQSGVVASRPVGRTRVVTLDPEHPAHGELRGLLLRLARQEPALNQAAESRATRPGGRSRGQFESPTDRCKRHLGDFFRWNDRAALRSALDLARGADIDLGEIERWALTERQASRFREFSERLEQEREQREDPLVGQRNESMEEVRGIPEARR